MPVPAPVVAAVALVPAVAAVLVAAVVRVLVAAAALVAVTVARVASRSVVPRPVVVTRLRPLRGARGRHLRTRWRRSAAPIRCRPGIVASPRPIDRSLPVARFDVSFQSVVFRASPG